MSRKRADPRMVKVHRSYSVSEAAATLKVHPNTVRSWPAKGLEPIDRGKPMLFSGLMLRAFLVREREGRKRPCPSGTIFCCRCREPRTPALRMVDYLPISETSGNLSAICDTCGALMFRLVRLDSLDAAMPGISVQIAEASSRLKGRAEPSDNCESRKVADRGKTQG